MARAGTLVLLSLLIAGCGVAGLDPGSEEERGAQSTASPCQRLESDPYVIAGAARGGANKGMCLETTLFRAARRLVGKDYREAAAAYRFARTSAALASYAGSVEQATSFAQLRTLLVANVRHRGTFWVAEIPVVQDSVKGSTFQIEEFIIPLAGKLPASEIY